MKHILFFYQLSKRQWAFLCIGLLLSIVTVIASLGLLSIAGYLICGAAIAGVTGTAITFNYFLPAAGVRFFAMVRIASRYGDRVFTHDATFRLLQDLRVWFYEKLEPLAPAILMQHKTGDLLSRMISDIDALDKLYLRLLIPFVSAVILVVAVSLFIGIFSLELSLILFCILLVAITIVPWFTYQLGRKPAVAVINKIADLRIKTLELGSHLMDLMLYGKTSQRIEAAESLNDELIALQKQQASIRGLTNALITFLTSISLVAVLCIGIPLVLSKNLMPANLGLLALTIFAVFEAILVLPQATQYISETLFASERLFEIAETKAPIEFLNDKLEIKHYDLNFKDVSFQYNSESRMIFENFNLTVKQGEHLAVIGETGIGKSTLAYLATRCFELESGMITVGGIDLKQLPEADLRDAICYVSQDSHMFNASLRDNLLIAKPEATDAELIDALRLVNLDENLSAMMGEFGQQFSGGQIRRIALARAFLKNAPVTVLDEPLEGVDAETAEEIWKNIQSYFKIKSLIIITHQTEQIPKSFSKVDL